MSHSFTRTVPVIGAIAFAIILCGAALSAAETAAPAAATAPAAAAATDTFVGTAKCKMCHMGQFRGFNSFVTDTTATVRMTLLAGVVADSKAVGHSSNTASYSRENLSCESCHGMGSRHLALGASNRDTEARRSTINLAGSNNCRSCHSAHPIKTR